jgi:hypothetical protein
MMDSDFIHILKNRFNRNANIYLLLIPIIIFSIVLALFVATVARPRVLGENATQLDNSAGIK